jgi:hypothetical protein
MTSEDGLDYFVFPYNHLGNDADDEKNENEWLGDDEDEAEDEEDLEYE